MAASYLFCYKKLVPLFFSFFLFFLFLFFFFLYLFHVIFKIRIDILSQVLLNVFVVFDQAVFQIRIRQVMLRKILEP